jgi:asparagine synthase (glutamine-hydrolysing)
VFVGPEGRFASAGAAEGGATALVHGDFPGEDLQAVARRLADGGGHVEPPRYGRFAAIVHRPQDAHVVAVTDRYGSIPLYGTQWGGALWLSPSLRWLVKASGRPAGLDEEALGELLTLKFVLGRRTILADVGRFSPATATTIDLGTGTEAEKTYWRPAPNGRRHRLAERMPELAECFDRAVGRVMTGARCVGVTLSGGLDSRTILSSALGHGAKVWALTNGIAGGMDHRYAVAVAHEAGLDQVVALLEDAYQRRFFDLTRHAVETYEGMLLTSGSEVLWLIEQSRGRGVEVVLHGALGELAKSATANHFAVQRSERDACEADVAGFLSRPYAGTQGQILEALAPRLRGRLAGMAVRNLQDTIRQLAGGLAPLDVAAALQILEHFRNSGAYSAKLWETQFRIHFPFADPDYVDLLLGVDAADRIDADLHVAMIGRLRRHLLRCPETNRGCRPDAPPWLGRAATLRLRVWKKFFPRRVGGHTDFCAWINAMTVPIDHELLGAEARARDLWDVPAVETYVAAARNGSQSAAGKLQRLLSVELLCRTLLAG